MQEVIIVVQADGTIKCWAQDTPELLAYLDAIQELSTCDCAHDHCPTDEMPMWRQQLRDGIW